MNKTEVLTQVCQKTGLSAEICEKIIKAFEEQSGDALLGKLKGVTSDHADMLAGIAKKTGLALPDCEKAVAALEGVMSGGLADKLKIFK